VGFGLFHLLILNPQLSLLLRNFDINNSPTKNQNQVFSSKEWAKDFVTAKFALSQNRIFIQIIFGFG